MKLPAEFLDRAIAHRGLHVEGRPENSLAAARAAVEGGFGIEVDLQLSADGVPVVFHDDDLKRLTGTPAWVSSMKVDSLTGLRLLGTDERIPTLAQLLETVDGRAPLLIELKDQTVQPGGEIGPLEAAVAKGLQGYAGPVAVMSFHSAMVGRMSVEAPDIPRGLTGERFDPATYGEEVAQRLSDYADYESVGACFVSHRWRELRMPCIHGLRALGAKILCWTVRSAEEERWARQHADNITFEGYLPA